ncbi:uncharacterized protein LAESUDRAFT_726336 [Laetiporus sulphureus 93-53]|uniref:Methylosome subunit pICln n=1 Tax=Laetiporus sulphureus 93-53 TaxID=1314785 RepID=A0A165E2D7_9APHY|nr:uncharacterized protein LAESUDRAFT_726336 [Laetiporus sulphureus 93-53]KZT06114.1 hypothetical protein LAESUDRAFT_726336 [Laetiporus sulphureus 93-53]
MSPFTLITTLPAFHTLEEHDNFVASTPASFSDIPPVLRHKEENVSVTIDPPLSGFSSDDCAVGTLYVLESVLVFMSATGRGFQVEYPSITLHAISRAEAGPSIYCQLDQASSAHAEDQQEEELSSMSELFIVPKDPLSLEAIFENLSICASLHPDPASLSDDMDDEIFADADQVEMFNGDEQEELSEVGRAALAHLESIIYNPFEQSEDQNHTTEQAGETPDE